MAILVYLAGFCLLIALYARYVEPNSLVVRKIRINSDRGVNLSKPLRIALISDLHYPRWTNYRMVRRAIAAANRFDPDLVFFLGDLFDKSRKDPAILPSNVKEIFSNIDNRLGVYGVLGNHDHWFDEPAIRQVLAEETNIRLIDNQSVRIDLPEGPLYLAGVGDLLTGSVRYDEAVANLPADASIILLSHNPDVVEDISDSRIIVQFSGHTHGGQIRLPFIGALRVPSKFGNKYSQGLST